MPHRATITPVLVGAVFLQLATSACSASSGNGDASFGGSMANTSGGASTSGGSTATQGGNPSPAGGESRGGQPSAGAGGVTSSGGAAGGNASAGQPSGEAGDAGRQSGGTSSASGGTTSGGGTSSNGGSQSSAGTNANGGAALGGNGGAASAGAGAPETKPQGYGQGTTGGGDGPSQRAASLAEMQALIDDYSGSGGLVIEYTGHFDFETISDPCTQHKLPAQTLQIKRKGDISILGADGSSANFGIHIASTASNVIVRNMTIGLTPGADASDIISIEGMSDGAPTKIWIDHNEFFTSMAECDGAGDTEFDGMIDIKKGADAVTVSYNYLHDHHKVSLNGSSDSDTAVRHITFHHNLFEHVGSRVPLQRGGYSHLFNNYFLDVQVSGINVRMNGYSLVEGNYFERVKNPVTSRDSDEIGFWELRANNLASRSDVAAGNAFGITWDSGDDGTVNATDWKSSKPFPVPLDYAYEADSFACVRAGLRAVVGPGKGLKTLKCQ